jgi:hypothetical protein
MTEEIQILMYQISARIYAGLSMVFLIVYTTLAIYEHFTGTEQWTFYFLLLGFGMFLLFYMMSGRTMKKALKRR